MRALDLLRQKIPLPQEVQKLQIAPEPVGWLTAKTAKIPSCSFCSDRGRPFRGSPGTSENSGCHIAQMTW